MPREPDPERMRTIPSETEVAIDPEILEQIQDFYDEEDRALHMGPGDHPSGTPQSVHGEGGGNTAVDETEAPRPARPVDDWLRRSDEHVAALKQRMHGLGYAPGDADILIKRHGTSVGAVTDPADLRAKAITAGITPPPLPPEPTGGGGPVGIRTVKRKGADDWEEISYSFPKGGDWTAEQVGVIPLAQVMPEDAWKMGWAEQRDHIRQKLPQVSLAPGEHLVFRVGSGTAKTLDNRNAGNLEAIIQFIEMTDEKMIATGDHLQIFKVKFGTPGTYTHFQGGRKQLTDALDLGEWELAEVAEAECHWVTLDNGVHVCIQSDTGEITKGPHSLRYKKITDVMKGREAPRVPEGAPKIYHTPDEVIETKGDWGSNAMTWMWKTDKGEPSGQLLKSPPRTKKDLPPVLFHVTTRAKAIESAPMLIGQTMGGGLGGGTEDGVSFTTSESDARLMQRELRRVIEITKNHADVPRLLRQYAREDEELNGLAPGALNAAVEGALSGHKLNYDQYPNASSAKDTFTLYLQMRVSGRYREVMTAGSTSQLKNPIIFGNGKAFAKMDPEDIQILAVPKENIPDRALITGGSDDWLNEVRAHSDVPLRNARVGSNPKLHLMEWPVWEDRRLHLGPGDHPNGTPQSVHGSGGGMGEDEDDDSGEVPGEPEADALARERRDQERREREARRRAPYPRLRTEPPEPPLPHARDPWKKPFPKAPPPRPYPTYRPEPEEKPVPSPQDPFKRPSPESRK